jgi:hypothetical protein
VITVETNRMAHHSRNYEQTVVRLEGIAASWAATGTRFVPTDATAALMYATSGVTGETQGRDEGIESLNHWFIASLSY